MPPQPITLAPQPASPSRNEARTQAGDESAPATMAKKAEGKASGEQSAAARGHRACVEFPTGIQLGGSRGEVDHRQRVGDLDAELPPLFHLAGEHPGALAGLAAGRGDRPAHAVPLDDIEVVVGEPGAGLVQVADRRWQLRLAGRRPGPLRLLGPSGHDRREFGGRMHPSEPHE